MQEENFGKFGSLEELRSAYEGLEADLGRSESRVKELEVELGIKKENGIWADKVRALKEKYPVSAALGDEITATLKENEELLSEENCLEKALLHVLAKKVEVYEAAQSAHSKNSGTPKIMSGGSAPVIPRAQPKTLSEVRKLAIERLKR